MDTVKAQAREMTTNNMLIEWLSPNSVFHECDYWNHIDRDICEIRDFKDLGILKEEYDFLL